jgi:acyl carrier protein phosphodiesterase
MNLVLDEARMHLNPDGTLTVWYVRGDPKNFYPTKIVAEIAAREQGKDYSSVYLMTVYPLEAQ